MTTEERERIERLELAVGALAENLTRFAALGPSSSPGVLAAQAIHGELQERIEAGAVANRRLRLEAQLAELERTA